MTDFTFLKKRVAINSLFLRGRTNAVTTLDILKSLALLLMIIDHIGFFLFPSDLAWRAIGRICVPIWFFLAGYNRPQKLLDWHLLVGGLLVSAGYLIEFKFIYPLNALYGILIVHLQTFFLLELRPFWDKQSYQSKLILTGLYIACLSVCISSFNTVWEYGTSGMLFGMCGFLKRDKMGLSSFFANACVCFVTFVTIQQQFRMFHFTPWDSILCALGMALAMLAVWQMNLTTVYPNRHSVWLRMGGRYTMEFYVGHLLLITGIYMYLHAPQL